MSSGSPGIPISIAIDGPAAAGKSTTAREVARRLGLLYLDSGAMYRALALKLLARGADPADRAALEPLLTSTRIEVIGSPGGTRVLLDGDDVTERLRDEKVAGFASKIAPLRTVRSYLVDRQREVARDRSVVMEGRDIGTVVLPQATVKIFLTASLEVRAERRRQELAERGQSAILEDIRRAIAERDRRDVERVESPLHAAPDAIEVDTTALSIVGQVERVLVEVRRKLGRELDPRGRRGNAPAGGGNASAEGGNAPPEVDLRGFYLFVHTLARGLAGALFRLRIEGASHLPARGGFILAANHASLIDPPLIGACASRRLCYLAKEELFMIPGLKQLISALGAVPVRRRGFDRQAIAAAKRVLAGGSGLLLFPEGTRTRSGMLGPARPGVAMIAAEVGAQIVPAYVGGTWGIGRAIFRRPRVVIRFGPPIAPPVTGEGTQRRAELRRHAGRIMQAIATLGESELEGRPKPNQGGRFSHAG